MAKGPQTFKVDTNVPIPPGRGAVVYPFLDMKPGDSFFVPARGDAKDIARTQYRLSAAAAKFRKREGSHLRFTTRRGARRTACVAGG